MTDTNSLGIKTAQQTSPVFFDRGPGIYGIKYNDLNANGSRDANEPGISNVQFLLEPAATANGTFNANTSGEAVATTATDGSFQFLNLAPGSYRLTELTPPPGFFPTTPNPISITVANKDVNVAFGDSTKPVSGIVGCKYLDLNGNGFRDGNEPGIKNVKIYLDSNNNGILDPGEPRTLTDQNGTWQFLNLQAGTYRVREERVDGLTGEPLQTAFPQSTPPNNVPLLDVTLVPGQLFSCAQVGNAPLYQIPVQKFRDLNGNGKRDVVNVNGFNGLEPPIPNVPFILDLNKDGKWETNEPIVKTDANGQAVFTNVPAGNYSVLEIFPAVLPAQLGGGVPGNLNFPVGTTPNPVKVSAPGSGTQFQGSINQLAPLLVTDNTGDYTRTGANAADPVVPAGQRPIYVKQSFNLPPTNPQPSVTFSPVTVNQSPNGGGAVGNTRPNINVFKYKDLNGNGIYEPNQGEAPISGVTVFLDTNGNGTLDAGEQSIVTNANGQGAFTNLPAGSYTVAEVVQSGFTASNPKSVTFNLANQDANVVFGNTPNSQINGCKFEDLNQNGYRDGTEPAIAGTTIYLDLNGNGLLDSTEPSTVTNANGEWSFTNLNPGTYNVREVAPPGYFQTTPPLNVVLGANQVFGCALIGNSRTYDLQVHKFRDDNRNGVQDSGEPPLVNIPFALDLNNNGKYDQGEPLSRTDSNGIATFTNLFPGNYSVLEVFNDPTVINPFPIPTGPNPVSFTVPGPNTVPSQPKTGATISQGTVSSSSIATPADPLTNPNSTGTPVTLNTDGTIAASSLSGADITASPTADYLIASGTGLSSVSTVSSVKTASSLTTANTDSSSFSLDTPTIVGLDPNKLLLTSPTSQVF